MTNIKPSARLARVKRLFDPYDDRRKRARAVGP